VSVYFKSKKKISMSKLFDGRLQNVGVREEIVAGDTTATARCLTDGTNYVWVNGDDNGVSFTLYNVLANTPSRIFDAVCRAFKTDILSEHQPEYWGFKSEAAMNAYHERLAQKHRNAFYRDLIKYLRGEPHGLVRGTIGADQAKIAKKLVARNPRLLSPRNKAELLRQVEELDRSSNVVSLTESDMAGMKMAATDEKVRPKA
jgi:hypothetical protein